ncbi:unnamed protein product [Timema podura]|uniref:Uncharacterized protein n=1 Tax=Timema podura TaxID=61482 RepID=A0ABN7PMH1_TIMPD|nr:unnamed protein product [Timema podura]
MKVVYGNDVNTSGVETVKKTESKRWEDNEGKAKGQSISTHSV